MAAAAAATHAAVIVIIAANALREDSTELKNNSRTLCYLAIKAVFTVV